MFETQLQCATAQVFSPAATVLSCDACLVDAVTCEAIGPFVSVELLIADSEGRLVPKEIISFALDCQTLGQAFSFPFSERYFDREG